MDADDPIIGYTGESSPSTGGDAQCQPDLNTSPAASHAGEGQSPPPLTPALAARQAFERDAPDCLSDDELWERVAAAAIETSKVDSPPKRGIDMQKSTVSAEGNMADDLAARRPFRLTCTACLWSERREFVGDEKQVFLPCPDCGGTRWIVQFKGEMPTHANSGAGLECAEAAVVGLFLETAGGPSALANYPALPTATAIVNAVVAALAVPRQEDPLGFNPERAAKGEAQARAGQHRPLAEVMSELRERHATPAAIEAADRSKQAEVERLKTEIEERRQIMLQSANAIERQAEALGRINERHEVEVSALRRQLDEAQEALKPFASRRCTRPARHDGSDCGTCDGCRARAALVASGYQTPEYPAP